MNTCIVFCLLSSQITWKDQTVVWFKTKSSFKHFTFGHRLTSHTVRNSLQPSFSIAVWWVVHTSKESLLWVKVQEFKWQSMTRSLNHHHFIVNNIISISTLHPLHAPFTQLKHICLTGFAMNASVSLLLLASSLSFNCLWWSTICLQLSLHELQQ